MASLGVHIHKLSNDPHIADWISSAKDEDQDNWQAANVREIKRGFTMNVVVPCTSKTGPMTRSGAAPRYTQSLPGSNRA